MTLLEVPAPRKLPVWRTVRSCYATVRHNLGQLARISWLWLLVMVPVYAAAHWLFSTVWAAPVFQTMPRWVIASVVVLPSVVELPFLASIAVAWHRLVLRHERVAAPAYLRLDTTVWLYALCSLGFLALTIGPLLCALDFALQGYGAPPDHDAAIPSLVIVLPLMALALVAAILLLPRVSLVLPALALGQRLSLWDVWVATQGNSLRLALATCLCMLPALSVIMALPLLSLLPSVLPWEWSDMPAWITGLSLINQLLDSIGYAVFNSLAYALLAIFAVTLMSLTYRYFVVPREERGLP